MLPINNIKSISLIALGSDWHWLSFDDLISLVNDFELKIYTTPEYLKDMETMGAKWYRNHLLVIKEDSENNWEFLNRIKSEIEKTDLLIMQTLRKEFEWFAANPFNIPMVLFVHCLNWWAFPKKKLSLWETLLNHRRYLPWYFKLPSIRKDNVNNRLRILNNVDKLVFHDPNMISYYNKYWKGKKHNICWFPYFWYDDLMVENNRNHDIRISSKNSSNIKFVVPGSIDSSRRAYSNIIDAFKQVAHSVECPIQLVFPGSLTLDSSYSTKLVELFESINMTEKNLIITYSKSDPIKLESTGVSSIPRSEYDNIFLDCDVIISQLPAEGKKMFKFYDEVYGESTAAQFADLIRYSKPGIFPDSFKMVDEISPICDTYSSIEELINIIIKYTNRKFLYMQTEKAKRISLEHFTTNHIRSKLFSQIYL